MICKELCFKAGEKLDAHGAAAFVQKASDFDSVITIELQNKKINAKSIMGVLSLKLKNGDAFCVTATGKDEAAAVSELEKLVVG